MRVDEEKKWQAQRDKEESTLDATSRTEDLTPESQRTLAPKEENRVDIPIPTRKQFERDLNKTIRRKKH
jgi:hypothetical protein